MKLNLKDVRADVVSRPNAMNGKYKTGEFGLEFWDENYIKEGPNIIRARADLADHFITEAHLLGNDINNKDILKSIAKKVNSIIRKRIIRNRIIVIATVVILIILISEILNN